MICHERIDFFVATEILTCTKSRQTEKFPSNWQSRTTRDCDDCDHAWLMTGEYTSMENQLQSTENTFAQIFASHCQVKSLDYTTKFGVHTFCVFSLFPQRLRSYKPIFCILMMSCHKQNFSALDNHQLMINVSLGTFRPKRAFYHMRRKANWATGMLGIITAYKGMALHGTGHQSVLCGLSQSPDAWIYHIRHLLFAIWRWRNPNKLIMHM